MNFKSVRCPSCSSPSVKEISTGKFVCESCGTSFMADYDKEDVEYEKLKQQAEREKREYEQKQSAMNQVRRIQQSQQKVGKIVALMIVSVIAVIFIINVIVFSTVARSALSKQSSYKSSQAEREEQRKQREEEARKQREAEEQARAAELAAKLAAYKVTPEELLADEFFVENATAALRSKLDSNTNLVWTNWVWNEEPEYLTSYLLTAKDDNTRPRNMIMNIYKVHWDKVYESGKVEKQVMYDATCLEDVTVDANGAVSSSYSCDGIWHSEIIVNQFLNGYTEYDQLIREEVYGQSEYNYVEFQFPGAVKGNEEDGSEGNDGEATGPVDVFVGDGDSVDGDDLLWDNFEDDDEE